MYYLINSLVFWRNAKLKEWAKGLNLKELTINIEKSKVRYWKVENPILKTRKSDIKCWVFDFLILSSKLKEATKGLKLKEVTKGLKLKELTFQYWKVESPILKSRKSDIEKSKVRYSILGFRLFNIDLIIEGGYKSLEIDEGYTCFEAMNIVQVSTLILSCMI